MSTDLSGIPQFSGARIRRREDPALITGQGKYTADFHEDGTLHLAFVRSPYAHARILGVDSAEAAGMAGVVAVLTGADINDNLAKGVPSGTPVGHAPYSEGKQPPRQVLSTEKVRFVGEAVAVVVATSPAAAADAVETIFVDYEPLDVVVEPETALAAGAPIIHEAWDNNVAFRWGPIGGEVAEIFANAAHAVTLRVENQRVIANALEPRAVFASHDGVSGVTTVWSTTQSPHGTRDDLAAALGIEADQLRVIAPEVGGGFGVKGSVYGEEIIATYLSRQMGKPIKWVATRSEDYVSTYHGRGQTDVIRLAADENGRFLAADLQILFDCGGYYSGIAPIIPTLTVLMMCGVYAMPVIRAEITAVFTNKHPAEPYRGAGRPEAAYLIERAVAALATEMGMDPAELRRRNYIAPDVFPYTTPSGAVYDSGNYAPGLEKALALVGYDQLRQEQAARRASSDGKLMGIGLATYVEICGVGPWEMGSVYMDENAKVTVLTGSSPHGQGHETTWAQIAADALQIPLEDIVVKHGDTAIIPRGIGTFGSRSTAIAGSSVHNNALSVRDKARQLAAYLLEAAEVDVVLENGRFQVVGVPERGLSWGDVAAAAGGDNLPEALQGGLESDTDFAPDGSLYPFGTHVAVVEVDPETGIVEIVRYLTVDDCGVVINPLLAEGQVHGGLAQGIGQALYEGSRYDELGNLLTGSLIDYALPRSDNFPHFETHRTETPTPLNPLGAKGIGEAATIGSMPTIVNAVVDALAHLGVRHVDMPLTAEKLWRVIHSRQ
ncbi:MAG: xanthine dehydrogenase family protein molybdopterin-binding subunit [Ardenticatenaceae bacterium]|nr:xanthine dehydrogenase family protein molybdopterin-binding subunit [Ardenticatenaceae bacterium]